VISIAQLMVVLDLTVMNIALPSAQRGLRFTTSDRQWVFTAYALTFGSLLLLGGRLADLLGRKVTFMTGLIGFAGVSAIGGASVNFPMLVTARACQGAFAAILVPSALSLLTPTFSEPADRAKAFGAGSVPVVFLLGTAIAGVGYGGAWTGAYRMLTADVAPGDRAGLVAAIFIVAYLSFSLPALIAGLTAQHFGIRDTAMVYNSVVAALVAAAAATTALRSPQSSRQPSSRQPKNVVHAGR